MRPYKRLFLLLLLLFPKTTIAETSEPIIRVAMMEDQPAITIESADKYPLEIQGTYSPNTFNRQILSIKAAPSGFIINEKRTSEKEISISNRSYHYKIREKYLKGKLRAILINGKITIVNDIPIETYISGLINSEISSQWPDEAIKAQAVVARTYAIYQRDKIREKRPDAHFDLEATIMKQVYNGAQGEDFRSKDIVLSTRGEILEKNGEIISSYYHSCCGGYTEDARNVWIDAGNTPTVEDKYCERAPKRNWSLQIQKAELAAKLNSRGFNIGRISSINILPLFNSSRVDTLVIENSRGVENIKAVKLREILGYKDFRSTWFELKIEGERVTFAGRGYGHGVGMCQWGAKGMAESGYSYADILKFYYPDAEMRKEY